MVKPGLRLLALEAVTAVYAVEKEIVTLILFYSEGFNLTLSFIIPPQYHTHLSSREWTIGSLEVTYVQRQSQPHQDYKYSR